MTEKEYKKEISKILYMMAEVFRDEVSDTLIEAWAFVLSSDKVTIEEAQKAALLVMKSREYNKLPAPAVFLEILRPQIKPKELAESQADEVLEAVRSLGPYNQPEFEDPITAELMSNRWRWGSFSSTLESDKVQWWRKQFVEAYCDDAKHAAPQLQEAKPQALLTGENK